MTGKPNRAERIIAFLESRYPGWVPAIELEPIGGRCAWRTAVSEARAIVKERGDDIENRVRRSPRLQDARINRWLLSEYRLKKRSEEGPKVEQASETQGHNTNAWSLT